MNPAIQRDGSKKGKGGFRVGAGRKAITSEYKGVSIRVDERLVPFLKWTKVKGVDEEILSVLRRMVDDNAFAAPEPPKIDLRAELTELYSIPAKNRTRDVLKHIRHACLALGFDADKLNYHQQKAVLNWHKDKVI